MTDIAKAIKEARAAGIVNVVAVDAGPTRSEIVAAKQAIKRGVMARYGGYLPIASIEVGDEEAIRYINGATIDELLA